MARQAADGSVGPPILSDHVAVEVLTNDALTIELPIHPVISFFRACSIVKSVMLLTFHSLSGAVSPRDSFPRPHTSLSYTGSRIQTGYQSTWLGSDTLPAQPDMTLPLLDLKLMIPWSVLIISSNKTDPD